MKLDSKFFRGQITRSVKQTAAPLGVKTLDNPTTLVSFSGMAKPEHFKQFALSIKAAEPKADELRGKIEAAVKECSENYEINSNSALGKCTSWPSQFQRAIEKTLSGQEQVQICRVRSKSVDPYDIKHFYLSVFSLKDNRELFIIDPTIAQFVQGHDKVFVGTRKDLKKLIFSPETKIINASWAESWRKFHREFRGKSIEERSKVQKLAFYKEAFGRVPLQLP